MAEALINHLGSGHFRAFSAGSEPTGVVHPESLATLRRHGILGNGYKSKSWDELKEQQLNIVITVCDSAAGGTCPFFSGAPDPAHFKGTQKEIEVEFERVFLILESRVKALVEISIEDIGAEDLQQKLDAIGQQRA